jgi:WD40 repeat protein
MRRLMMTRLAQRFLGRSALLLFVAIASAFGPARGESPAPATGPVSYHKDVKPLLVRHCQGCHQPARLQGNYLMTEYAALFRPGEGGNPGIVAGKPEASELIAQITPHNGQAEMPKNRPPLAAAEIQTIREWIRQGAHDDTPLSARVAPVSAENPPVYEAPPVIPALAYAPDGNLLAVAGYHEVLLHSGDGKQLLARLVGLSERIQSLAFSPSGTRLAVAAGDPGRSGEVQIWDVPRRKLLLSVVTTTDTVYGVSWSPDENMVAVGGADNTVRAFDSSTGKPTLFMGTHADWVLGTCFSRDGKHLVSVSRDMTLKLTEVETQRFIDNVTSITPGALKGGLMAVDIRPITAKETAKVPEDTGGITLKPYDELLVGGADGVPRLYKMHRETKRVIGDDANKLRDYAPLAGRIAALTFDPYGRRFAAASSLDGTGQVRIYEVGNSRIVNCQDVSGPAYTVAWHPSGQGIASAGAGGVVWLHDAATGQLRHQFSAVPITRRTAQKSP